MKLLSELVCSKQNNSIVKITGITSDSREVRPGFLFAAFRGARQDGVKFIPDAVNRGAVAVLVQSGTKINSTKALIISDDNPRNRFARIASRFYSSQPEWVGAVTGTNGKTSVAIFATQILQKLGEKAAAIGTLGVQGFDSDNTISLTTPEPVALHKELSRIASCSVDHVVIEASSHGLDQHRLDGINCKAAAFTNLSHDHIDYHKTFDNYLYAKKRLFSDILNTNGIAVINRDSNEYDYLESVCNEKNLKIISYGFHKESVLRLLSTNPCDEGQKVKIKIENKTFTFVLSLFGSFQSHNALCALGLVIASGKSAVDSIDAMKLLKGVRGRMDLVATLPNNSKIFVDYAHTPAALETALLASREYCRSKIYLVFGCGGDRDKIKRKQMGIIAEKYANNVFVTDDNPRSEDPKSIRKEILQSCSKAIDAGDRKHAIKLAIKNLSENDVLLVAGKGHETNQLVGEQVMYFDDFVEINKSIKKLRS